MLILTLVGCTLLIYLRGIDGLSPEANQETRPGGRLSSSCGSLLVALTSQCASVRHSKPYLCCAAIKAWNSGFCWCQKNAFNSAANIAMDYFAFQFRTRRCNITSFNHPEITLPVAAKAKLKSTCPELSSKADTDVSEGCGPKARASTLRQQRLKTLRRLSAANVYEKREVREWSKEMDSILAPGVSMFSIGMSFLYPRVNVKRYLLSRTTLAQGALWEKMIEKDTLFWLTPGQVSYSSAHNLGPFSFRKIEFVTFERCSPRIQHVFTQEEEAVRVFKQFIYFEPATKSFWQAWKTPRDLCSDVQQVCPDELFPFKHRKECIEVYKEFYNSGRVTCARDLPNFPLIAFHGDTLACRGMYLNLARVDNQRYCRFLGFKGIGLCRESGCPAAAYNNMFAEENPRFDSPGGYICSTDGCNESWPSES